MNVQRLHNAQDGRAKPAETVTITPKLTADDALSLSRCDIAGSGGLVRSAERGAEVALLSPQGKELTRGMLGFS